ncbi:hypothetical protein GCM10009839_77280 [Catenulispora yoronensis]|uniref:Uncharacterized protein n=1 Tax=Catenulispora yoronensis TaxID=450799 RepID=A0ABN2VA11_9ACTN
MTTVSPTNSPELTVPVPVICSTPATRASLQDRLRVVVWPLFQVKVYGVPWKVPMKSVQSA